MRSSSIDAKAGLSQLVLQAMVLMSCACMASCTVEDPNCLATGQQTNLLLITIDTLRADHLGAYGYGRETSPVIDQLARQSVVFDNAYAPMPATLPSHVSMMTGMYPWQHGITSNFRWFVRAIDDTGSTPLIAEELQRCGYRTAAFTSSSPVSEETGIGLGFDDFSGPPRISIKHGRQDIRAEQTINKANQWLAENHRTRFFLWVHLFDPHDPYAPPRSAIRFGDDDGVQNTIQSRGISPDHREQAMEWINGYDGEIRYADGELGRLLDHLTDFGLYDTTTVILVGDHGEGLWQNDAPRHQSIWNAQLRVPLMIRSPQLSARREHAVTSLVDLVPTLRGLGFPVGIGDQLPGRDLFNSSGEPAFARTASSATAQASAMIGNEWKLWVEGSETRLYHLSSDPHELRDVADTYPEVLQRLYAQWERVHQQMTTSSPIGTRAVLSEEDMDRLRSLGYVQ